MVLRASTQGSHTGPGTNATSLSVSADQPGAAHRSARDLCAARGHISTERKRPGAEACLTLVPEQHSDMSWPDTRALRPAHRRRRPARRRHYTMAGHPLARCQGYLSGLLGISWGMQLHVGKTLGTCPASVCQLRRLCSCAASDMQLPIRKVG